MSDGLCPDRLVYKLCYTCVLSWTLLKKLIAVRLKANCTCVCFAIMVNIKLDLFVVTSATKKSGIIILER